MAEENTTTTTQNYVEGVKDLSNSVANEGQQLFSKASDSVSNMASTGMNTVNNSVAYATELGNTYLNNLSSVFYAGIVLLIVCLLIGWGLYILITDNITHQQRILVSGTEAPIICNEASSYSITQSLETKNGQRCSFSFWIYINDMKKYDGQYRHILHIGESQQKIKGASPYIILDKDTNKIHIRFSPLDTGSDPGTLTDLKLLGSILDNSALTSTLLKDKNNNRSSITIDYVPIQRWVHICVSINDTSNGIIYVYIDAELAKVFENNTDNLSLNISALKIFASGTATKLFVGGDVNDYKAQAPGFSGLISKFTMYNHDLNQNDVYREYTSGPFSGLLTKVGLGMYGIRNPIYKINSANNN